jgi:hypothetical protein
MKNTKFIFAAIFSLIFVFSCVTTPSRPSQEEREREAEEILLALQEPKYGVNDCLMIVDLPRGETTSPLRVRVEKIENGRYWYRWWLGSYWDMELTTAVGEFRVLEKISLKVEDCPL